jgi:hypothetical protein
MKNIGANVTILFLNKGLFSVDQTESLLGELTKRLLTEWELDKMEVDKDTNCTMYGLAKDRHPSSTLSTYSVSLKKMLPTDTINKPQE